MGVRGCGSETQKGRLLLSQAASFGGVLLKNSHHKLSQARLEAATIRPMPGEVG